MVFTCHWGYNLVTMKETSVPNLSRDPRLLMLFLTIIVLGMYAVSIVTVPAVRQPLTLVIFTLFIVIHLILHWMLERLTQNPKWIPWYIISQGLIALAATLLSGTVGMVYALFMGLIGEGIGLLGLKRGGVLAVAYYLLLSLMGFTYYTGISSAGWWAVGTLPIVIFVATYVTLYMRQVEAREKAQALAAELESANRQLAEYAAQVEDLTIANERQRMARELHDTLSQGLAGLILQLEAADAHLTNSRNEKAQSIIGSAMEQARTTLADARRVIDDLRQPSLDDLDSALRLELDRFTNATGIPVHFHSDPTPPLPDSVKENLVRALAESLTNIANHARAQSVDVELFVNDNAILLTIQDDGIGFDASSIPSGHYGILGIKERVRLVNGSFELQSENGRGTMLKIKIPIRAERSASVDEAPL
jgi:two-component system, NarL family, sensor histidine kinase YdfH